MVSAFLTVGPRTPPPPVVTTFQPCEEGKRAHDQKSSDCGCLFPCAKSIPWAEAVQSAITHRQSTIRLGGL